MEVDDWLLKKLFGAQAEKKLTDPQTVQFVQELATSPAVKLVAEPGRLGEEKYGLQEETESLAFDNYKTFIQAANCSKDIYEDFTLINERLERAMGQLPNLNTACKEFLSEAQKISGKRATNTLALNKHTQVLQVLEIPQVMDTCVRAGYWEEALEVIQYVAKLQRRIGHIGLVGQVAAEVEAQRSALVDQLLEQLHLPLSLPQCLKVVAFLRRLGVFTEAELRIKFLLARGAWLKGMLASIPATDPYEHITRHMEQSRVHLFDIITQYRAVFTEDEGPAYALAAGGSLKAARPQLPTHLPPIFQSWLLRQINEFLVTLETDLERGVGSRLDSVAAQVAYFGQSFGRVGADFRTPTLVLLERAAYAEFGKLFSPAKARLLEEVQSEVFLDTLRESGEGIPVAGSLTPPSLLLSWPGLAHFTNAVLGGLNALRAFAPLTLAARVASEIQGAVEAIAIQLVTLASTAAEVKRSKLSESGRLLGQVLVPFLNNCLEALFPTPALVALLQSSPHQKMKVGRLNSSRLSEILDSLLPRPILLTSLPEAPAPVPEAPKEDKEEPDVLQSSEDTATTDPDTEPAPSASLSEESFSASQLLTTDEEKAQENKWDDDPIDLDDV